MPKPKNIVSLHKSDDELKKLTEQHAELYAKFLPTLESYQDMAKRALDLQVKIFGLRLAQLLPDADFQELSLIAAIRAAETPANFDKMLAKLVAEKITVVSIVYDPRTFTYMLFGKS